MLTPLKRTCPPDGSRSPVRIDTVVDFPEPLGPSSPSTPPAAIRKLTSRTAGMAE